MTIKQHCSPWKFPFQHHFFMDLRIKYKIIACAMLISALSSIFISVTCYAFFAAVFETQANKAADDTVAMAVQDLSRDITGMYNDLIFWASAPETGKLFRDIHSNRKNDYGLYYSNLQDRLDFFKRSNRLISSTVIVGQNGALYSHNNEGLKFLHRGLDFWKDIPAMNQITWLSVQQNLLVDYPQPVNPVVFPICMSPNPNMPIILSGEGHAEAYIYVLLDAGKLSTSFEKMNKNLNSTVYLANESGQPLSAVHSDRYLGAMNHPQTVAAVASMQGSLRYELKSNSDSYIITAREVGIGNLKIVSIISKSVLLGDIAALRVLTIGALLFCLLMSLFISLALARTITRPLSLLMGVVANIEQHNYSNQLVVQSKDEIGVLNQSINSMTAVIGEQMETIKLEEKEQARAEIDILSEQINPHFLYNTLECIHWEILNSNIEGSANMVESLGDFLRLGLNSGQQTISIGNELRRTEQYVKIMNHRMSSNIQFISQIEDNLNEEKILKLILQPIAENSIRHGFGNDPTKGLVHEPYVCISVTCHNQFLRICVEDNGQGIDLQKATAALQLKPEDRKCHVGLNNVFRRLRMFYGQDVSITFETTPYYKNQVVISIPYSPSGN